MAIELISKIKQKNNGQFFLVDATDIDVRSGDENSSYPETSLSNYLDSLRTQLDNVVTDSTNGLMSAADKVKLDGIEEGANNYVHPDTHLATMITEDETHRFVSDTEKETWNAKADTTVATETANGLMSAEMFTKLDGIEEGANNYVLPAADESVLGGVKTGGDVSISSGVITVNKAEADSLGNKISDTYETKEAASAKLAEAKTYTDRKIFVGTTDEYNTAYANGEIPLYSLVILLDDEELDSSSTTSVLGQAILGQMILG